MDQALQANNPKATGLLNHTNQSNYTKASDTTGFSHSAGGSDLALAERPAFGPPAWRYRGGAGKLPILLPDHHDGASEPGHFRSGLVAPGLNWSAPLKRRLRIPVQWIRGGLIESLVRCTGSTYCDTADCSLLKETEPESV